MAVERILHGKGVTNVRRKAEGTIGLEGGTIRLPVLVLGGTSIAKPLHAAFFDGRNDG